MIFVHSERLSKPEIKIPITLDTQVRHTIQAYPKPLYSTLVEYCTRLNCYGEAFRRFRLGGTLGRLEFSTSKF